MTKTVPTSAELRELADDLAELDRALTVHALADAVAAVDKTLGELFKLRAHLRDEIHGGAR